MFKQKKTLAPVLDTRRLEFFECYTRALDDFVKQLEEHEKNNESKPNQVQSKFDSKLNHSKPLPTKQAAVFTIEGKTYTMSEIHEICTRGETDKLAKTKREREKKSKQLLEILLSQECKVRVSITSKKSVN